MSFKKFLTLVLMVLVCGACDDSSPKDDGAGQDSDGGGTSGSAGRDGGSGGKTGGGKNNGGAGGSSAHAGGSGGSGAHAGGAGGSGAGGASKPAGFPATGWGALVVPDADHFVLGADRAATAWARRNTKSTARALCEVLPVQARDQTSRRSGRGSLDGRRSCGQECLSARLHADPFRRRRGRWRLRQLHHQGRREGPAAVVAPTSSERGHGLSDCIRRALGRRGRQPLHLPAQQCGEGASEQARQQGRAGLDERVRILDRSDEAHHGPKCPRRRQRIGHDPTSGPTSRRPRERTTSGMSRSSTKIDADGEVVWSKGILDPCLRGR